ncbi:endo-1,4-beta-xylanase [bacterium]|nr:endo-1,4-beta-xylanase [bacterium]
MAKKIILFVLAAAAVLSAQTDPKFEAYLAGERANLPVEGRLLYNAANIGGYRYGGGTGAVKKTVDADSSLPFGKAVQLYVKQTGANSWEPQFQSPANTEPIREGDVLFYIFYIRGLESSDASGDGKGFFYIQRNTSPWTGLGSSSLAFKTSWQKRYVAAQAQNDFDAGTVEFTVHLGYFEQRVEIGGILAFNLGQGIDMDDLPINPLYWDGMEADAPWRAAAAARIENQRKGNLRVIVENRNGEPLKNASVHVRMKNHAYGFGTFIANRVLQNNADAQKYKAELLNLFNRATTPFYMGDGGWGWYASEANRGEYCNMAGWLQDHDIPAKGHVLIWPGWTWMPPFFRDYQDDPAGMRAAIDEHLETLVPVGEEKGLAEWDVVNEPHINHDVMDICGDEILIDWYKRVHELDPAPRLILNEYNILMGGGDPAFQADFERTIELLLNGGAPLGGLGMQCHFDENLPGIPRVLEILDRFSKYDLPIQVTEMDIDTRDEEGQAGFTRDFLTAVFSHPMTDKIVLWGFWEGDQWKPNGSMIRTDWSYKPNYHVYQDLVFNQWWTEETGATGGNGFFETRGFLGEYEISAGFEGHTVTETATLAPDGLTVEIEIPTSATGAGDRPAPAEFGLLPNYPNPFNPDTTIPFRLDRPACARLTVFSLQGEAIAEWVTRDLAAGEHEVQWHAADRPSGLYLARLQTGAFSRTIKMVLQK